MAFPTPVPGLVIRYSYLWSTDYARGREEGSKDRPCALVLAMRIDDGETIVTVLPVTHSPPTDPRHAIEIPLATKRRLGLDNDRSWILLNEANQFLWPGPDLRPTGKGGWDCSYGLLPFALFEDVRQRLMALLEEQRFTTVPRTK